MSIKDFSPLWESWEIGEVIGQGTYGTVYKVYKKEYGKTYYSAVKHISIPANKQQVDELYAEGMVTEKTVNSYYEQVMMNLRDEIETNYALKGNSHIVSYEDHKIVPKKDGIGYDIFIRMELLTSLSAVLKDNFMSVDEVVKLGIDLCRALETLENKKIIHRDIKPSNLFIGDSGNYKLGDFGVARELNKTVSGMSVKGTFKYMAPEIQRGGNVNLTADIYSLGVVMYHLLNFNRAPFLPQYPKPVSYADNEKSVQLRMSGQALPMPANADTELAAIVLKACEYLPERRYQNAKSFRKELERYQEKRESGANKSNESSPLIPINSKAVPIPPKQVVLPKNQDVNETVAVPNYAAIRPNQMNPQPDIQKNNNANPQPSNSIGGEVPPSNNSTTILIVLLTVCITLIVAIGGCFIYFYSEEEPTTTQADTTVPTSEYSEESLEEITEPEMETEMKNGYWDGSVYKYINQFEARVTTEKDPLMLREGPSTGYDIIKKIPKGAYVTVIGANTDRSDGNGRLLIKSSDWLYVEYGGKYGWSSASFLEWENN